MNPVSQDYGIRGQPQSRSRKIRSVRLDAERSSFVSCRITPGILGRRNNRSTWSRQVVQRGRRRGRFCPTTLTFWSASRPTRRFGFATLLNRSALPSGPRHRSSPTSRQTAISRGSESVATIATSCIWIGRCATRWRHIGTSARFCSCLTIQTILPASPSQTNQFASDAAQLLVAVVPTLITRTFQDLGT